MADAEIPCTRPSEWLDGFDGRLGLGLGFGVEALGCLYFRGWGYRGRKFVKFSCPQNLPAVPDRSFVGQGSKPQA